MTTQTVSSGFRIAAVDGATKARAGVLHTANGPIETPVFMPVGTQASVKTLDAAEVHGLGYRIILGNTYHLMLRPGRDILVQAGGLGRFMRWPGAILTDSGGYQVFSLAARCRRTEDGVEFASHIDGSRHVLTPASATAFQMDVGSDIAMCLDECPPYPALREDVERSADVTTRWAEECRNAWEGWRGPNGPVEAGRYLFGIVQGGAFADLRRRSAQQLVGLGLPGYAIGGLGLGEPRDVTWEMTEEGVALLPAEKPRYLMGFGQPEDMWEGVERGIDMFDCVLPTRNARNGQALTSRGRLNLTNARFRTDFGPLDPTCACATCASHSRAYLFHLFRAGEMLAPRLVTLHNLFFMLGLLRFIRHAILDEKFPSAKKEFLARFQESDGR